MTINVSPATLTYTRDALALRSRDTGFLRQFHGRDATATVYGKTFRGALKSNGRCLYLRLDHPTPGFDGQPVRGVSLISRNYNNGYLHGLETVEVIR